MNKFYLAILKDDENIGHTHLLDEKQVDDCIAELEKEGYSYFMLEVSKLFDSDTDSLSDIIYDWR